MSFSLPRAISRKLENHRGRTLAIRRDLLLDYLHVTGFADLSDRDMRECVEKHLPRVCSCNRGYYIAADSREKREAVEYHRKKALAELAHAAKIDKAYPEFSGEQLRLEM